ncbi:Zinc finger MYM-type protein [Arachis hypogaea]|nr:Zinc finger MYM-type protein [Arachis hypogaea]
MAFQIGKKKERLQTHVGIHDSAHNQAWRKCEALMKPKQHISAAIEKQSEQAKKNYQIHLTTTIDCIRFLFRQGLAFRGDDETDDSVNQGNFLELLNLLAQHNEEIDRAFKNARGNLKLRAPSIQKDIVRAAVSETTKAIVNDLGDELFAVLVDEARDISIKEQMCLFKCKRRDMLRDSQMTKTIEALQSGEISSGRGLNQEIAVKRAGDTRWGSHYGTILRLISLFPSVVNVLEYVEEDGNNSEQRAEACHLLNVIQSFEFIFNLHLMKNILGVTNELSQALQRTDQDIVNAMALVKVSKQRLQTIRDDGWSLLLDEVSLFCDKHNITVPKMDDIFVSQGRSRRKAQKISNLHHFQVEIFYQVVNRQLQELNNHFTEVNTEMFLCIACLNPRHSFLAFDKEKLIQLAQFYPLEFSSTQLLALDSQLENFILDVRSDDQFSNLNGIGVLSQKLVEN